LPPGVKFAPRGNLASRGDKPFHLTPVLFTPSFATRDEHSLLLRRMEGQTDILSTFCWLFGVILSTYCQHIVDILPTFWRHFVDILSTYCRLFGVILSTFCRHIVDFLASLRNSGFRQRNAVLTRSQSYDFWIYSYNSSVVVG
jgi:hypothetical protein